MDTPVRPQLNAQRQKEARSLAVRRRILSLSELAITAALLAALVLSGLDRALRDALSGVPGQRIGLIAAYFLVLWLGLRILLFPLSIIGWRLARRFGLSVQPFADWLGDWAKGSALSVIFGLVTVEIVYWLLRALPDLWWLAAAAISLLLTVGLANLAPLILVPLFYKLKPLDRPTLAHGLENLAREAGVRVQGVYQIDLSAKTTAANAALMGLGNTRRIVIGDTLLDQYSEPEVEAVFAHELGHHVHHDIPRQLALQTGLTLVGLWLASLALRWADGAFGFEGIDDIATLPVLMLVVGAISFLASPLTNWYSRRAERAADRYALRTTNDPAAFIATMIKLANQNLAVYNPPKWIEVLFEDHPALAQRVAMAERFEHTRTSA